jgi:hypothetical protein
MTCRLPIATVGSSAFRRLALAAALFFLAEYVFAQPALQTAAKATEIILAPSALTVLARHLSDADPYQRLEFAQLTLDALIDAYHRELDTAMAERPSTQERRLKLARWKEATQALLSELSRARWRLSETAEVSVTVDGARQVIVFVDQKPVIVTASRPELDQLIAQSVVEQFCAFNDCSFLERERGTRPHRSRTVSGSWHLSGLERPVYEAGGKLHCVFADLTERIRKAAVCAQLLDQLLELHSALDETRRSGHRIDWRLMAAALPRNTGETVIRVNKGGAFLRLLLPLLTRLDAKDWEASVTWLKEGGTGALRVSQADRLLP